LDKAAMLTYSEKFHTMDLGNAPANLDNGMIAHTNVQVSRELITPNGCHMKLRFSHTNGHEVRKEIAQLLLTAFMREKEVE